AGTGPADYVVGNQAPGQLPVEKAKSGVSCPECAVTIKDSELGFQSQYPLDEFSGPGRIVQCSVLWVHSDKRASTHLRIEQLRVVLGSVHIHGDMRIIHGNIQQMLLML